MHSILPFTRPFTLSGYCGHRSCMGRGSDERKGIRSLRANWASIVSCMLPGFSESVSDRGMSRPTMRSLSAVFSCRWGTLTLSFSMRKGPVWRLNCGMSMSL